MAIEFRPITKQEAEPFFEANRISFGAPFDPALLEGIEAVSDYARSMGAFDGNEVVGTAGSYSFELTVPGNSLPIAGVTWVGVKATHRRRGVLTGMMRRQLDLVHEWGEPIAALWASEAPIYGRFGYGCAAEGSEISIDRAHSALRHVVPWTGRTRYVSRDEALADWPGVYERVRREQPGMISRSEAWWSRRILPEEERPHAPYGQSFRVTYSEDGRAEGYVKYRVHEKWDRGCPASDLLVVELVAASDAAYSALWSFVFSVDLIGTIKMEQARAEEPLIYMLEDPRRLERTMQDTLYVRLVDVAKALEARRYASEGRLAIAVRDKFCGWNAGTYVLEGGLAGATCRRDDSARPDITLDAETLGAAYLGGIRFQALAHAGRVEGPPEALHRADAMFTWSRLPYIGEIF